MNIRYQIPLINQYLYRKADVEKRPLGGTFELTPLCNMDCKMCYVKMTPDKMKERILTADEWIQIAEEARNAGTLFLLLTGGEPFLRSDFKEIYLRLHKMGFVLTINSNGTLITEEQVEWLKEAPPTRINITVYGASDETYRRLCNNPKGYQQVMKAIHLLKDAGIEVKLNYSVTPHNAQDFSEIKKMAVREGLFLQATTYLYPPLRKSRDYVGKNDRFSPEVAAYYTALSHYYEYGREQFLNNYQEENVVDICTVESAGNEELTDVEREHIRCRAGTSSFWITWSGRMTPCGMMDHPAEKVGDAGFEAAWNTIVNKTREILMPSKCTKCALKKRCSTCAAMVLAETGGFEKAPEYRCQMVENYANAREKIKEQILNHEIDEDIWNESKN